MGPSSTEGQFFHYWQYHMLQHGRSALPTTNSISFASSSSGSTSSNKNNKSWRGLCGLFTVYSLHFVISGEIFRFTPADLLSVQSIVTFQLETSLGLHCNMMRGSFSSSSFLFLFRPATAYKHAEEIFSQNIFSRIGISGYKSRKQTLRKGSRFSKGLTSSSVLYVFGIWYLMLKIL